MTDSALAAPYDTCVRRKFVPLIRGATSTE